MLELIQINKSYKVGDRVTEALKNISISFRESEFVSVLGPSGCGKTTLLNVIGGLDRYDSGDLIIRGISTLKYKDRNWDTYRNHSVGFVFQSYNLIPHQTVFSNVELALTLAGVSRAERKRRVLEALEKVGLSDQAYKKPNQMSGGQMQRVAIARAIVNDPEILLADEPTGALDSKTSVQIMEILKEISAERLIIMVTHNPELAEAYSTRIVRLKDGEIVSDSNPYGAFAVCADVDMEAHLGETVIPAEPVSPPEAVTPGCVEKAERPETDAEASAAGEKTTVSPLSDSLDFEAEALDKFRRIKERSAPARHAGDALQSTEEAEGGTIETAADAATAETGAPETVDESDTVPAENGQIETITEAGDASGNTLAAEADEKEDGSEKIGSKGRKKHSSMSFFTALSLSFNNILTKKGRTFITAFAGSIGIIGIALILAISTGVQNYIDDVQRETLSSYPITIEEEHRDLTSILLSARKKQTERNNTEKDENTVYSSTRAYDLFNAFFSDSTKKNNLKDFKSFLESEMKSDEPSTEIDSYITTVHYGYGVGINTFVKDEKSGNYLETSLLNVLDGTAAGEGMGFMTSALSSSSFSYDLWDEIIPAKDGSPISDLIKDQYDLIYGEWPQSKEDILLLVDKNNEIPDMAFYTLGIMSREDLTLVIASAMSGKEVEVKEHSLKFSDLANVDIKLVLPADLYTDPDGDGLFSDARKDGVLLQPIVNNSLSLRICGVIRANPDASSTAITANATFCYTNLLTEYIIQETAKAPSVRRLLESEGENLDIFNGLPYYIDLSSLSDEDRISEFRSYPETLSQAEKAEAIKKIISTPDEKYVEETLQTFLSADTREQMEALIAEAYGAQAEAIKQYLSAYSDEELFKMISETAEETIKEKYAQEAEAKIDSIIETPSAFELLALKTYISSQFKSETEKIFFVSLYWEKLGAMTTEESFAYLTTLTPEAFKEIYNRCLEQSALSMYAENASADPERVASKLADAFDKYVSEAADEEAVRAYNIITVNKVSDKQYQDNKKTLGILDLASPKTISIYPDTFEDKEKIADIIAEYNDKKTSDEDRIYYTDVVAIIMSGITTIINAISYVLIAFVAVSLVVSSIMIGIITYISVLERTKEIGILRSIGASKKDVARVFTAETLIIGLASGVIGIGASFLLCFPINAIVHYFTKINTINAVLPPVAAAVLVVISMLLTFIAGLFPSGMASRKDPVEALRTE